jgi:hypothetical protein
MEKRLEQLEKKMDQKVLPLACSQSHLDVICRMTAACALLQNDSAQKLSIQITDIQASFNKRLGLQEQTLKKLNDKKGCACIVS